MKEETEYRKILNRVLAENDLPKIPENQNEDAGEFAPA
jgi:hypothetical protein